MKQTRWLVGLILVLILASSWEVIKHPNHLGLDLVGGVRGVFTATSQTKGHVLSKEEMATAVDTIRRRINRLGVSETQVQQKGSNQLIVEIPLSGEQKTKHLTAEGANQILQELVKPAFLEFVDFPPSIQVDYKGKNGNGEETYGYTMDGRPITEKQAFDAVHADPNSPYVIVTGKDLEPDATAGYSSEGKGYEVSLHFRTDGAKRFGDYTTAHVPVNGKYSSFGIALDGHLISYPRIESAIPDGNGQISGGFGSLEEAQHLAVLLNAGALPVNLKAEQTSIIEATLGASSVHTSVWAGIAGLILVIVFMCAYYRLPGILASVALLIYTLYVFALFKWIPVTLTLPGIAGFILSVGMAVDANVLIFERLKEEIRAGRTLRAAIDAGFSRALSAIVDSNACTLISCAVLGFYGTGPVKGFAVTLAIGVLVSLFTAVTVTRTFLHLMDNSGALKHPEWFGVDVQWMGTWAQKRDIIGRRKLYYAISLGVIVPGLIFICLGQLRLGVDFTGGTEWIIKSSKVLSENTVANAMQTAGIGRDRYELQNGRTLPLPGETALNLATIHAKVGVLSAEVADAQHQTIINKLHEQGVTDALSASSDNISPLIGSELELNALRAVLLASLFIIIYLTFRFSEQGLKDGIKYGVCAIVAMLHDVFVVIGLFAIFGFLFHVQVDMNFMTAVLTIVGFSVHDTIVIFDRVRENLRLRPRGESFEETYNRSIRQTAARSINTSFTVILVLLALILRGAPVIFWFNVALLIGIISGTYSSIFNASPLVVDWQLIKRRRAAALAATSPSAGMTVRPGTGGRTGTRTAVKSGSGASTNGSSGAAATGTRTTGGRTTGGRTTGGQSTGGRSTRSGLDDGGSGANAVGSNNEGSGAEESGTAGSGTGTSAGSRPVRIPAPRAGRGVRAAVDPSATTDAEDGGTNDGAASNPAAVASDRATIRPSRGPVKRKQRF